jgi:hypothetical protein
MATNSSRIIASEGIGLVVIQATKREPRIMRYDLSDHGGSDDMVVEIKAWQSRSQGNRVKRFVTND